ncbi:MAG: radical SAM protein [Candidatus Thermoplasmatota archaeon]
MKICEVYCKTALVNSMLSGIKYALNPYRGCLHGCIYCYAPSVLREKREWGEFVDIKINIPYVLGKELRKKEKGLVCLGTVTDAYQQIEKEYELARKCLELLLKKNFPITIQTKSSLVLRDMELIKRFKEADVGFTITTMRDEIRRKYEPNSSSNEERLKALSTLSSNGIKTWVFIGPIMPFLTEIDIEVLIESIKKAGVEKVYVDRLRIKDNWEKINRFLIEFYPELIEEYKRILFRYNCKYFTEIENKIMMLCNEKSLEFINMNNKSLNI